MISVCRFPGEGGSTKGNGGGICSIGVGDDNGITFGGCAIGWATTGGCGVQSRHGWNHAVIQGYKFQPGLGSYLIGLALENTLRIQKRCAFWTA